MWFLCNITIQSIYTNRTTAKRLLVQKSMAIQRTSTLMVMYICRQRQERNPAVAIATLRKNDISDIQCLFTIYDCLFDGIRDLQLQMWIEQDDKKCYGNILRNKKVNLCHLVIPRCGFINCCSCFLRTWPCYSLMYSLLMLHY